MLAAIAWWALKSSVGRMGLAAIGIAIGLWGTIQWAENRGAAEQIEKQQRVDSAAKARADQARRQVRAQSKQAAKAKKPEPKDGFQRD